jgi:tight adherence protein C
MSPAITSIFEAAMFVFATALVFFVLLLIDRRLTQSRRLGTQAVVASDSRASILQARSRPNAVLEWIQESSSLSAPEERQRLRRELALAGFDSPLAPIWYVIARFGLAIGLPFLFLLFELYLSPKPLGPIGLIFWAMILCIGGLILPSTFVQRSAASRRRELEFEFPDALDLMVVCVEAGLSLDAALVRVGQEVHESHPRISRELERTTEEIRAGRSRSDALRAMAERCDVAGIKSFVALVIQTEQLGSSITQTLRTYSNELRETRYIKAEEKALRIPVLMTVPLVACILPVIVTALLLPPIIDMIRTLFPALGAH